MKREIDRYMERPFRSPETGQPASTGALTRNGVSRGVKAAGYVPKGNTRLVTFPLFHDSR